jgi:hypothetical protein
MRTIKEIKVEIHPSRSGNVKAFLRSKGYEVCEVIKAGNSWRAVITKNSKFIIATVFTRNEKIAGFEVLV